MIYDYFPPYSPEIREFDPSQLKADPDRFQFKSCGNRFGVTSQLLSIKEWESAFSGIVYVWESIDGFFYISDGHQRLGLALRMGQTRDGQPITLRGCLFKESDGWTVPKMRVFAAAKNIAEGGESTKALDVAKLLRNGGPVEFLDQHVSNQRRCYRDGKSLANLGDDCFGLVLNRVIPEQWGIVVGLRVDDPKQQMAIIDFLRKNKPNADNIVDMVEEAVTAGFVNQTQTNLFGEVDITHALIAERIQIYVHCVKQLKAKSEVLGKVIQEKDEFKQCGLDVTIPAVFSRRQLRQTMLYMIPQARLKSPLSLALTEGAKLLRENKNMTEAASHFMAVLEEISIPYLPISTPPKEELGLYQHTGVLSANYPFTPDLPMALPMVSGQKGEQVGLF